MIDLFHEVEFCVQRNAEGLNEHSMQVQADARLFFHLFVFNSNVKIALRNLSLKYIKSARR